MYVQCVIKFSGDTDKNAEMPGVEQFLHLNLHHFGARNCSDPSTESNMESSQRQDDDYSGTNA